LYGFDSVFSSVLIFTDGIGGSESFDQMLAVFGDPSHVKDKFSFYFSFGAQGLISLDSKRCQYDITLFITSVSLNEEPAFFQNTVNSDLLALPVIDSMIVEFLKEVSGSLIVADSLDELSLSLIILIGDKILDIPVNSRDHTCQNKRQEDSGDWLTYANELTLFCSYDLIS
jgi:hypothetical protein